MQSRELRLKFIRNTVRVENVNLHLYNYKASPKAQSGSDIDMLHTHSYFELFACISGELTVVWESGEATLSPGDVITMPPSLSHTKLGSSREGEGYVALGVNMERVGGESCRDLCGTLRRAFNPNSPVIIRGVSEQVSRLREVLGELDSGCSPASLLSAAELFCRLADLGKCATPCRGICDERRSSPTDEGRLVIIEQMINDSFREGISPSAIASEVHLCRRQVERIVKERYGMTLRELLRKRRVEYGAQLLLRSEMSVEEVAEAVGYVCRETFTRSFTDYFGKTPSRYREESIQSTVSKK